MGKRAGVLHQKMGGTAIVQQNDCKADGVPGGSTIGAKEVEAAKRPHYFSLYSKKPMIKQ
jgi:hypothetical protein